MCTRERALELGQSLEVIEAIYVIADKTTQNI